MAPPEIRIKRVRDKPKDKIEQNPAALTITRQSSTPQKPQIGSIQQQTVVEDGSVSPRRRGLIDKFSPTDFFEGQPDLRVRFTEVVRKFNLELMKSTCQVMKGCKPWKAKQIADSVYELLNEILTKIHER